MSIPRNLGNFADNVNANGKVEVTGINATGTPSASTALLGNGTWGTVTTSPAGSTGQVQYNNAGAFGAISSGTSGQVLTSAGSGSAPTWSTPSAGALVFISSQTVTSAVASVDFTSGISSTYDDYVVYFDDVTPTGTGVNMRLRLYKSGAFQTTNYSSSYGSLKTTINSGGTNAGTYIYMSDSQIDNSQSVVNGTCTFFSMNSTLGNRATAVGQLFYNALSSSAQSTVVFGGNQSTAAATTGFQFFFSSGNINSGTFRLYGVAKS